MKKLISMILCVALFLGCITGAYAETVQESGSAVDIVLLIDQSGSIWNSNGNDKDGYRLDAAQMVIALLGMNGSRVAFVPFAARVFDNADRSFHEISGVEDYHAKMEECQRLRANGEGPNGENSGGTDFAEALVYAYNMLAKRTERENNQPMIILLTDGGLEIDSDSGPNDNNWMNKRYYTWNAQRKVFDPTASEVRVAESPDKVRNQTYYASELLNKVVSACVEKEYPVYTVSIAPETTTDDHFIRLNDISSRTGAGNAIRITGKDSEGLKKLPAFFGDMFASRIGSSELRVLNASCIDPATNLYEVKFVIPNESVTEANLFVSKEDVSSTYLLDAEGNRPSSRTVMELSSDHFVLYKLTNPNPYGIWRLRFTKNETAGKKDNQASDISFNLLYNYDIVLHGFVSEADGYEQNGHTFRRGDKLAFSGKFYDNSRGAMSEDPRLYSYEDVPNDTTDDWCRMVATYELRQVTGNTTNLVCDGTMSTNGTQFYQELDMKEVKTGADGYNVLAAGDYRMIIHVEGSGLVREVEIPFTLTNTLPANNAGSISLNREVDGNDEASHRVVAHEHSVAGYVVDYDNDQLVSDFVQTDGQDVIALTYDASARTIISIPVQKADGKLAYGNAHGELRVREVNGEQTVIPVTMRVTSGNDAMTQCWNMRVTADGEQTGSVQEKNTSFDIRLELLLAENGRQERSAEEAGKIEAKIEIVDVATNELAASGTMEMGDDCAFTYTHTTGSKAGKWQVTVSTFQKKNGLPVKVGQTDFKVQNEKPVAVVSRVDKTIYHNPLPEFLSFLGEATPETDLVTDLTAYFTEKDNEPLSYVQTVQPSNKLLIVEMDGPKCTYKVVPGANDETEFRVLAHDNDGEKTNEIVFHVTIVDLVQVWTQRGLMALAVLIALILLIVIIRQIRKPKFPKGAVLGVREGSSDYDTSTYEFVPSKKPISLAAVVMTDTAAKFGISANVLTNIILTPVRSTNGSIGVRLNKKMDDVSVALTTKAVKKGKKPAIWVPGDSLILNSRSNTTGIELNIWLFPPETPVVSGMGSSIDGPFQLNGDSLTGFNNDVDAFGANDVSGSFGGLAPSDPFIASAQDDNGFGGLSVEDSSVTDSFAMDDSNTNDFTPGF